MSPDTILLVDRDAAHLDRLAVALGAAEYAVETARSPEEALAKAAGDRISVLLLALRGEDTAAIELLHKLRAVSPQTECILLCEETDRRLLAQLYETGNVYAHHWKPLQDLAVVGRDVAHAVELRRVRRQNGRLLVELRDCRDEIRSHYEFLAQCERLAAIGSMTTGLCRELSEAVGEIRRVSDALRRAQPLRSPVFGEGDDLALTGTYLAHLQDAAASAHRLLADIESFARSEESSKAPVQLHEVVYCALGLLAHSFSARGIRVRTDLDDSQQVVLGSAAQLGQVFTHLALNAIAAMPSGGTLHVMARGGDGETGGVRIEFRDTGAGIPQEVIGRVFDPFFTTRPFGEGTGLGLAVARQIIRDHGGSIDVESAEGRGATFRIILPVAAEANVPAEEPLALAA